MPKTLSDPTSSLTAQSLSMRFRLIHLIYAVTLLATSLGTFGAVGLGPGISLLLFWTVVFGHASRPKGLLVAFGLVIVGCCCAGFLLPAFSSARGGAAHVLLQ